MSNSGKRNGFVILTTPRLLGLVVIALFLALLVLFVADNFVLIEIRFVNTRVQVRLAWALLSAFLMGGIVGFLTSELRR